MRFIWQLPAASEAGANYRERGPAFVQGMAFRFLGMQSLPVSGIQRSWDQHICRGTTTHLQECGGRSTIVLITSDKGCNRVGAQLGGG